MVSHRSRSRNPSLALPPATALALVCLVALLAAAGGFHLPAPTKPAAAGAGTGVGAGASGAGAAAEAATRRPDEMNVGLVHPEAPAQPQSLAQLGEVYPDSETAPSPGADTRDGADVQISSELQSVRVSVSQSQSRARGIINGTSKVLPMDINNIDDGVGEGDVMELPNSELPTSHRFVWSWLEYLTYGAVVKGSCIVGNIAAQLSPYPSVKKLRLKGDTGDFDALPLVTIAANSVQWCFYGVFAWWITGHHGFLILLYANVLGAVAGSYYTAIFHELCRSPEGFKALRRYYNASVAVLAVQVLAVLVLPPQHAMFFEGFMASACSIFVAVSPVACIPTVLRTRSTESMPVELALASFLSAVLWLTCGVMLMDWWIIIPNVVGIVAGVVAIMLLFMYPRHPRRAPPSEATPLCAQDFDAGGCGCTGGTPSTLGDKYSALPALLQRSRAATLLYDSNGNGSGDGGMAVARAAAVRAGAASPFTPSSPGIY